MNYVTRTTIKLTTLFLVFVFGLLVIMQPPQASAAPVVGFNPGLIIDDGIFTDTTTMNTTQIQSFLLSKVPVCDTWGTGGSTPTSRRDYIRSMGYDVPLKCLMDYTENGKSAAQIIYDAAQEFRINPQVILVLLQKEQALVTDDWPGPWQFRTATGYGCPDTAACDSQYFGLTNQIRWAARMFRAIMDASPTWYTPYVVGNNYIRYNPNASCGGTTVNIQNRSTQALYNYTPYQPNASALNAGYGSGDACGAYGNRNFYLYFSDWFGPTTVNSTLLRTASNGLVYLVSGSNKHPILDNSIVSSLRLGGVGYVSQGYLDSYTTGKVLQRVIIDKNGGVYYFDVGIKLGFTTCAMVEDYGYSCEDAVQLTDFQINSFVTGPNMTPFYKTVNGKKFYIRLGEKREVFDDQSLTAIGLNPWYNVITEAPLGNLAYGLPVTREGVIIRDRLTKTKYLNSTGQLYRIVDNALYEQSWLRNAPIQEFDKASIDKLSLSAQVLHGYVTDATTGDSFVITAAGKIKLNNPELWPSGFVSLSSTFLATVPSVSSMNSPYLFKGESSGAVYVLENQKKRFISSWSDVVLLNAASNIMTLSDSSVARIQAGHAVLAQGSLVKSSSSAAVYYVDGLTKLVPVMSFSVTDATGLSRVVKTVDQNIISSYTLGTSPLSTLVQCGSSKYIAISGSLHRVSGALDSVTGLTYQPLTICPQVQVKDLKGNFFLDSDGGIYYISDGQKQLIAGWNKYVALGGNDSNTQRVSKDVLVSIPTGPTLY